MECLLNIIGTGWIGNGIGKEILEGYSMKKDKVGDIAVYSQVIDLEFCNALIREFHVGAGRGEVIEGVVSGEGVVSYRSDKLLVSKDIHFYDHERWDEANVDLHEKYLLPVVKDYLKDYKFVLEEETRIDPRSCIMSLYEKGRGQFCPHQDSVGGLTPQRSITVIAYLNTVDLGGCTEFFNQDCLVRPEIGSVLVFPSNFVYAHKGNVPISGDKYITVSFVSVDVGTEDSRE